VSKDPTTFTVLFEDSAALLGLLVAFLGIFLAQSTGDTRFDGAASILIGLILMGVAGVLAYESKGLLVGESADPRVLADVRTIDERDSGVERVRNPLTMHFGPETVLLTMDVQFRTGLTATEVAETVDRLEQAIRMAYPNIKHIFLEAESIVAAAAVTRSGTANNAEPIRHP
jgi:divalent metal cation (Fe/Co/Zn/Cd) transporter